MPRHDATELMDATRIALEEHDFEVEEIAQGGGFRISKYHGTANVEKSEKLVERAQHVVNVIHGGSGPHVRFPVEGGREGQMAAEVFWE